MWSSRHLFPRLGVWAVLLLLLAGCNLPARPALPTLTPTAPAPLEITPAATEPPTPPPSTPTLAATPTRPPETSTPASQAAGVSGKICFPGASIPAMTVYFENVDTHAVVELPVQPNQSSYALDLPPGSYQAYAWLPDFSQGGLYSPAVACGLKATCKDHTPLVFKVEAGRPAQGIDVCDWYAGAFSVPYPPGKQPGQLTGKISGAISYPAGATSALRIVAFNLATQNWYYVNANPGATRYTISDLPPGVYQIVAYDSEGRAGGYADTSHTLLAVTCKAGETTGGADITDWSAPAGTFPPDPTR